MSEEKKIEKFIIKSDKRSITFEGTLLISVSSNSNNASSYYSGQTGIAHTIKLYKSIKDNFIVVYYKFITQWQGSQDEHEIFTGTDLKELIESIPESRCKKWFCEEVYDLDLIAPEEV